MRPHLHRRSLLGLAAAAVAVPIVAGCTSTPDPLPPPPAPTDTPDTSDDSAVRDAAAMAEATLIARYAATIDAHPGLAGVLTPIADQHHAHRRALLGNNAAGDDDGSVIGPISPDPTAAIADLVSAERAAAEARTGDCDQAQQVDVIRLLALIAASEASHAEALSTNDSAP